MASAGGLVVGLPMGGLVRVGAGLAGTWVAGAAEPAEPTLGDANGSRPNPQAVHASTRRGATVCQMIFTVATPVN